MIERKLALVKKLHKQRPEKGSNGAEASAKAALFAAVNGSDDPLLLTLSAAEEAEAARFRALTKERAAQQAKVRRIKNKLRRDGILKLA